MGQRLTADRRHTARSDHELSARSGPRLATDDLLKDFGRVGLELSRDPDIPSDGDEIDAYTEELTTFPDSDFSEQVDSTTQALSYDVASISFHNAIGRYAC